MRLLLLAGTAEARQIGAALAGMDGVEAIASLAGDTAAPADIGLPLRIGGFGGDTGFARFLDAEGIGAVLDATHPFARRIAHRTARICAERGLHHARVLRPEWQARPGDDWIRTARPEDAAQHIPEGAAVFLAAGHKYLDGFANLAGRRVFCRRIDADPAPFPFRGGRFVTGRPPFTARAERDLFARLGIRWLVTRNSGGAAGRAKLDAARAMGVRVVMIDRPEQPEAQLLDSAPAALNWVRGLA